ncbi:MAG TPA: hypothetical protein VIA09_07235 [Nitrososphaeraceae archaeon]
MKCIEASIQLQQTAFTAWDGTIANKPKWIENHVNNNKDDNLAIDEFL